MSALDHLRSLARGDRPSDDGLLGNARCAWGRGEVIGEEGILAHFCTTPLVVDDGTLAIETGQGAALIGTDDALLADVYDGRIGRLWRVGTGVTFPPEQAVDVAFDIDMQHERGGVCFRAEDHPELSASATARLLGEIQAHLEGVRRAGSLRVRAFVVRAFGDDGAAAALLSIYALSNHATRSASSSYAIVGIGAHGEPRVVSEQSLPRAWTPRL